MHSCILTTVGMLVCFSSSIDIPVARYMYRTCTVYLCTESHYALCSKSHALLYELGGLSYNLHNLLLIHVDLQAVYYYLNLQIHLEIGMCFA